MEEHPRHPGAEALLPAPVSPVYADLHTYFGGGSVPEGGMEAHRSQVGPPAGPGGMRKEAARRL